MHGLVFQAVVSLYVFLWVSPWIVALMLVFMFLCRWLFSFGQCWLAGCRCLNLDFVPSIQLNPWTCLLNPKLAAVAEKQNEQKSSKVDIHCWLPLARLTYADIVGAAVEFFLYCLFSLKLVRWFLSKGDTACWMVARHIRGGLTIQHSFYSKNPLLALGLQCWWWNCECWR